MGTGWGALSESLFVSLTDSRDEPSCENSMDDSSAIPIRET